MKDNYWPQNTVISVAGNFSEDKMINLIKERFSTWKASGSTPKECGSAGFNPGIKIKEKDTEQIHICIAFEGIEHGDDDIYSLLTVNNVLGGGMSSRLFQKIREESGLVYSIYSYPSSYKKTGLFTIYAGMNPEHLEKVLELIMKETKLMKKEGITKDELEKSREQLKGSYILGLESTSSRMNSIGKAEVLTGNIYTPDEILKKIDEVSLDKVEHVINRIFSLDKICFSAVGNIKKDIDLKNIIGS